VSASRTASEWVFGYGSLAAVGEARADGARAYPTELRGARRRWGVAMDNRVDLPGYKWYRVRATGERADGFVAFLDVVRDEDGGAVNGLCMPVDHHELALLDARERNYERVDVTDRVADARGRVWAYVGSAAGRARLAEGVRSDALYVSSEYVDDVEHAFRDLGAAALRAYAASTERPPPVAAVVSLERVDLPT
jgi:hypothetical protein